MFPEVPVTTRAEVPAGVGPGGGGPGPTDELPRPREETSRARGKRNGNLTRQLRPVAIKLVSGLQEKASRKKNGVAPRNRLFLDSRLRPEGGTLGGGDDNLGIRSICSIQGERSWPYRAGSPGGQTCATKHHHMIEPSGGGDGNGVRGGLSGINRVSAGAHGNREVRRVPGRRRDGLQGLHQVQAAIAHAGAEWYGVGHGRGSLRFVCRGIEVQQKRARAGDERRAKGSAPSGGVSAERIR